jgi:alpha-D-ribose 1-methylphosphonate 5-triphosphate synthase subunit PhnI
VAGVPKLRTTVRQNTRDLAGLPAVDNVVTEESLTSAHQGTLHALAILQVHGRYLDAVYLTITSTITADARAAAATLAITTGRRLVTQ